MIDQFLSVVVPVSVLIGAIIAVARWLLARVATEKKALVKEMNALVLVDLLGTVMPKLDQIESHVVLTNGRVTKLEAELAELKGIIAAK